MKAYFLFLILFIISFCFFIYYRVSGNKKVALTFKMTTSTIMVFIAVYLSFRSFKELPLLLIVYGNLFALLGDLFLELKVMYKESESFYLKIGFLMFAICHLFYIVAMVLLLDNKIFVIYGFILGIVAALFCYITYKISNRIGINYKSFKRVSLVYMFILTYALLVSLFITIIDQKFILFLIGYILFISSDLVLSKQYFGNCALCKKYTIINHLLYYMAIIFIVSASVIYLN